MTIKRFDRDLNHIHCGGIRSYIKEIPDGYVDLIVTDPPYGMDFQSNGEALRGEKIANDHWNESLRIMLREYYRECARILKDGGAIYSFCSHHHIEFFLDQMRKNFKFKRPLIWNKRGFGIGDCKGDYAASYEFILYGAKGRHILRGKRHRDVLDFPRITKKERDRLGHLTPKPVDLIAYLIQKSSDPGDLVFDGFMGSGATARAAERTFRFYLGAEKIEDHWRTAMEMACEEAEKDISVDEALELAVCRIWVFWFADECIGLGAMRS